MPGPLRETRKPQDRNNGPAAAGEDLTQDLDTRTSQEHSCHTSSSMQGPLREDRASISTKSSDTDLYKMQEPLIKDLTNSTRSYHKDSDISSGSSQHGLKVLYKTLAKIFIYTDLQDCTKKPMRDRHTRTFKK